MLRTRDEIESDQLAKLNSLLGAVLESNPFYRAKFAHAGLERPIENLADDFSRIPLTAKHELVGDQQANSPYGTNLTYPLDRYSRFCQTSATTGEPLRWLDTSESWQWMIDS